MRRLTTIALLLLLPATAAATPPTAAQAKKMYPWERRAAGYSPLVSRLAPPTGFIRVTANRGSYAHWLRHLPLLPQGTPVRSYRGRVILPADHKALAAVVDLSLSKRDRQQCADTIMRLRGEYLYQRGKASQLRFRWAGGKRFGYAQWSKGLRPKKQGRKWAFVQSARPGRGYRNLRRYLEFIFSWTGTLHMAGEPRVKAAKIQPGDFFIQGGSPGHVVLVMDMARDAGGRVKLMVGQGFMPAQDLHVLRAANGSPWFDWDPTKPVISTPGWWRPFTAKNLRRFRY